MLYEVITFNDVPTIQKADKLQLNYLQVDDPTITRELLVIKDEFPVYPNPSTGVFYIDTQNYRVFRITSYNVCYTKLLRIPVIEFAVFEHTFGFELALIWPESCAEHFHIQTGNMVVRIITDLTHEIRKCEFTWTTGNFINFSF